MKNVKNILSITLMLSLLLMQISCTKQDQPLGSKENPIKISLTPGKDVGVLLDNGNKLKSFLEKDLDLSFDVVVPANYISVVESFGSKRSDLSILNTVGYLIANTKYNAHAIFTLTNHGHDKYKGQIIARSDSNIKSIKDLNKKKIAYVDPISSSGYLLPSHLLKESNITPKEIVFAGRHDGVVSMVYQKQVDAGATFWLPDENNEPFDARRLVLTQYPDVFKKIRIIAFTEYLPNEAFVLREGIPEDLKSKLIISLKKWIQTVDGKKTLKDLYNCDGLKEASDKDYDSARKLMSDLGQNIEDLKLKK